MSEEGSFRLSRLLKGLISRKDVATPAPPNTPKEDPSAQEIHRTRVAELARSLFMNFDAQIASAIGFDGNILETLHERRPTHHNDGINTAEMAPTLKRFVDGSSFSFRITDPATGGHAVMYKVDCYNGGFYPEIELATEDGSVKFEVLTGPNRNEFDSVRVTKYSHDKGQFSGARTIRTFVPNYKIGQPDYPLLIEQRTQSQRHVEMRYGNVNNEGDVQLLDGEHVSILPSSKANDYGVYSASAKTINWKGQPNEKPDIATNEQGNTITVAGDFSFPIQTNIYQELQNITSGTKPLPQLPSVNK